MVYKVSGEFTNENLNEFVNKLKLRYKIVLKDDSMYLALINYSHEVDFDDRNDLDTMQDSETTMNRLTNELKEKVFVPFGNFFVKDLTKKSNIEREDEFIQTWCKENISRLAKEIIEVENQVGLRLMMNKMDDLENELQERMKKIEDNEEVKKAEANNESNEPNKNT